MAQLTAEEYQALVKRIAAHDAWVDTIRTVNRRTGKRTGWASYKPDDVPEHLRPSPTNDERSSVERYEFIMYRPDKYFGYVKLTDAEPKAGYTNGYRRGVFTTFTGEVLGTVVCGGEFRGNMGNKCLPVRIEAINGCRYSGTLYIGAGSSYARVRKVKGGK